MNRFFRWLLSLVDPRSIRSDLVTAAILALCTALVGFWGWWTNKLSLWATVLVVPVPLPLWMLLLLVIGTGLFLFRLFRPYLKPAYVRHYRRDVINDVLWVWDYNQHNQITNATPLCPTCQTEVVITPHSAGFDRWQTPVPARTDIYCPTCNAGLTIGGTDQLVTEHALPKIRQRIRTGTWPRPSG
jgi:hypothetical protein